MYDAQILFVRAYCELRRCLNGNDPFRGLELARLVRQLLFDANSLVDQVNKTCKLKLEFVINPSKKIQWPDWMPVPDICSWGIGLSPTLCPGWPTATVNREALSKVVLVSVKGHDVTLKELVKHGANKLGGVHVDHAGDEHIREGLGLLRLGHDDQFTVCMQNVAQVVAEGLTPLRENVIRLPAEIPVASRFRQPSGHSPPSANVI